MGKHAQMSADLTGLWGLKIKFGIRCRGVPLRSPRGDRKGRLPPRCLPCNYRFIFLTLINRFCVSATEFILWLLRRPLYGCVLGVLFDFVQIQINAKARGIRDTQEQPIGLERFF